MSLVFRSGNTGPGVSPGPSPRPRGPRSAGSYAGCMVSDAPPPSQQRRRGAALGLPADGPGSLAGFGTRVQAYLVDAVGSGLVAVVLFGPGRGYWTLLTFAVVTVVSLVLFGQTPGMRLLGLRLAHPRAGERLAWWRAVVRTALLCLLVPALVVDADGRGLHDRLTDTAVVRER
jgi:uncharacterized RDD family membrane protein YckC